MMITAEPLREAVDEAKSNLRAAAAKSLTEMRYYLNANLPYVYSYVTKSTKFQKVAIDGLQPNR